MATASTIIENVRRAFGDPDGEYITNAVGMEALTAAEIRFCHFVLAIDEVKDYTIRQQIQEYDLPSNCIEPTQVIYYQRMQAELAPESPVEFQKIQSGSPLANPGRPRHFTVFRRQLVVGPQSPVANSATALASGAQSSTASTINLTAASGTFRSRGFLVNGSSGEVISYASVSTTQVGFVQRGLHGTPAASISSNDVWTQIDMQMFFRRLATAISTVTQTPETPVAFQRYLEAYMLYKLWLNRGDATKAQVAYNEFEVLEAEAKKTTGRRILAPMSIKDYRRNRFSQGYW